MRTTQDMQADHSDARATLLRDTDRQHCVRPGVVDSEYRRIDRRDVQASVARGERVHATRSSSTSAVGERKAQRRAISNCHLESSAGLDVNDQCSLDLAKYGSDHACQLHVVGTHGAYYVPDELQANFSGGQYFNIGVQRVWKRRPASTYRTMLLEYCAKPHARMVPILQLRLGLEYSACSGNAQRVTLWEALKLAYPADIALLEDAYAAGAATTLSSFIMDMRTTGIDQQGHLQLFWPQTEGLAEALELSHGLPAWCKMLKDTRDTTCFAVLSGRCLTYHCQDEVSNRHIRRLCSRRPVSSPHAILHTKIALNPASEAHVPLPPKANVKIPSGYLRIRNAGRSAQLACFEANSYTGRIAELAVCTLDGRSGHMHRELLDEKRSSSKVLQVCIMD